MQQPTTSARPWHILAFSAATIEQLDQLTARLRGHVRQHPEHALDDLARALSAVRQEGAVGRAVVCGDRDDALAALAQPERMLTGDLRAGPRSVAFLFPGLGEQYVHMGSELYQGEPVFREAVDTCAAIARPLLDVDLRDVLALSTRPPVPAEGAPHPKLDLRSMLGRAEPRRDQAQGPLQQTSLAQPATFMIEYALAQLWLSWGIRPGAMLGYSIGEYVAACLAEVMSLPDALRLVILRARLIQGLPEGGMLAVPLPAHELEHLLGDELSLAAINGESLSVLAGTLEAIERVQARLTANQQPAIRVQTTHAFHSKLMDPITRDFEAIAKTCTLRPPRLPYVSNVTGTWIGEEATDPAYWVAHLRQPVRCSDGLHALWRDPARVFLEVGPGRALTTLALHNAPDDGREHRALPSLRSSYEAASDEAVVLDALGRLWLLGVPVDWERVLGRGGGGASALALEAHLSAPIANAAGAPAPASRPSQVEAPRAASSSPRNGAHAGRRPRPALFTAYAPPRNELERTLAGLWQEALKIEAIGVDDNFFELGGHSLLAISIANRLESDAQVQLPLSVFFDHPTVAQLARVVADLRAPAASRSPDGPGDAPGDASGVEPPGVRPAPHHAPYVLPNGLEIRHQNKAETDHFYEDIFEHRTYVRHLDEWPEHACVFDVGANIGLFSLFIHSLGRGAKIYAFEPSPPTFEVLRDNLTRHGVDARIFEVGLSDAEKTAELTFYPFSSGMSSVYGSYGEEEAVLRGIVQNQARSDPSAMGQVMAHSEELFRQRLVSQTFACRLRTLSSIIREQAVARIDLLKIDVQKSELDVLMGIEPHDWEKIGAIAIEVHDLGGRLHVIEQLLKQHAYDVEIHQDELYRGTGIYLLYARRGAARPALRGREAAARA